MPDIIERLKLIVKYECVCVCLCASIKEKRHRRQSNAGDLFFTAFASVSVCVSARLCARALVFVCVDHQRAAVKTPERQGSAHPPQRCSDTQNNAHTPPQKKNLFQDSGRISCLFLLPITRATLAQSGTPSPPRARLSLLPPAHP